MLHDAEDVVHSAELGLFDALIERADLVQLPVLPLIDPGSRFVGGHYADEFCEAHGKELVVREAIGAGLPSAGVGCAIARDALDALAGRNGAPFDPDSLTEDYELGLAAQGEQGARPPSFGCAAGAGPGGRRHARIFPGDARCGGRAKGALDGRHRAVGLGPARLVAAALPSAGCGCATASRCSPPCCCARPIWR